MNEKNNKRTIFGWSMYDWAKSAYETTTLGAVLPVYFVSVVVPEEGFVFRGNVYSKRERVSINIIERTCWSRKC